MKTPARCCGSSRETEEDLGGEDLGKIGEYLANVTINHLIKLLQNA
jgi:hypothetical protein